MNSSRARVNVFGLRSGRFFISGSKFAFGIYERPARKTEKARSARVQSFVIRPTRVQAERGCVREETCRPRLDLQDRSGVKDSRALGDLPRGLGKIEMARWRWVRKRLRRGRELIVYTSFPFQMLAGCCRGTPFRHNR